MDGTSVEIMSPTSSALVFMVLVSVICNWIALFVSKDEGSGIAAARANFIAGMLLIVPISSLLMAEPASSPQFFLNLFPVSGFIYMLFATHERILERAEKDHVPISYDP